jgi:hypothetical protein
MWRIGDVVTFDNDYRRRTFWEWLVRAPRQLQRYRITETNGFLYTKADAC